jgi:peptidyl-prolyl cis-trans isomerase A (cyclophilin A)
MITAVRILVVLGVLASVGAQQTPGPVRVLLETEAGEIEATIDTVRAPITAANFLKYVDGGLFDGGTFFRTVRPDNQVDKPVKIAVIQAAGNRARRSEFFPAIPLERTNVTGLSHKDGTLSMARAAPDTARDSFSICVGDQPSLDFGGARQPDGQGFAAFGQVIRGMDVVRTIQASPAIGETLTPAVGIVRARRLSAVSAKVF